MGRRSTMNAGSFRRLLAALIAVLAMAALASSASAKTEDIIAPSDPAHPTPTSGWQAGTCTKDTPTCTVATTEQFFEEASAHPQVGFTQFIVRNKPGTVGP